MRLILISSIFLILFSGNTLAQKIISSEVFIRSNDLLGEGAFWDYSSNQFIWIDIEGRRFNLWKPTSQAHKSFNLSLKPGTVVPVDTGGYLFALQDKLWYFNPATGIERDITDSPEKEFENHRFNDGKCDPAGRFWVGTMASQNKAALYSVNATNNFVKKQDSVTISNGIVWSLDTKKMYYIDTPTASIVEYAYDLASGDISSPKIIVSIPDSMGYPDGMSIDCNGNLWVGLWHGYAVACFDPNSGKLLAKVLVPAPNVTSCAFTGENLDILLITTARVGLSEKQLQDYPLSGSVFRAFPNVKGCKSFLFNSDLMK